VNGYYVGLGVVRRVGALEREAGDHNFANCSEVALCHQQSLSIISRTAFNLSTSTTTASSSYIATMKYIILSSLTVVLTLAHAKDHTVALRGAEQIPTFEYVDVGASIQCNGPNASRPCPEGKPLPYTCDDGSRLCCIVKPKGKEDLMSEVVLVPYGTCRAEESVRSWWKWLSQGLQVLST
jgi:hypothetical protein